MAAMLTPTTAHVQGTCKFCHKTTKPGREYCDTKCELDYFRAENQALRDAAAQSKGPQRITVKRSKLDGASKGNALCVYGLGRYPIALYREQWEALLADEVVAEIKRHLPGMPLKAKVQGF